MIARAAAGLCLGAMLAQGGTFRAGAARVEITPSADSALPLAGYGSRTEGHKGIHDPLYARAVVFENGAETGALVACDVLWMTDALWQRASERIAREAGIPREAVLLAAVHTHGAPALGPVKPEFAARWEPWRRSLEDRIVEAVAKAKAALQPARAGAGTGKAYVNTNRRARQPNGGWGLGINPEGPSDKTVAVVKVETLEGKPIAVLVNYPVHGTVMGPRNYEVTGDLPGAAARFVEEQLGPPAVAVFTAGASGDQNPIYEPGSDFGRVDVLGRILGEEAVRVAAGIRTSPRATVRSAQRVVTCPGREPAPGPQPHPDQVAFKDGDPVPVRVSVLRVGTVVFAGVSGEVLTNIGERLKRESPYARTIVVTHCNGSSGYIPDDASYAQRSYEIWVTKLKPGCAEDGIVNAALDLIDGLQ